ncbi:polysaccharide deacetylase family protein [Roseivivax sp. CAU 1761]
MTSGPDRRRARRRLFAAAGLALGASGLAGGLLLALGPAWLAALALAAGPVAAAAILHRPGAVPILVYHSVSPDAGWLPWAANTSVRPEVFRHHLEALRRGGWTVLPTRAFVTARARGAALRDRTALLHFDDGYLDNLLFAVPILREYGMPATFFVSTDFIDPSAAPRGRAGAGAADARGYMNAVELRALEADPLFEVEAHGTDHARVPVSAAVVDRLTEANWRRHLPLAWAQDAGNKARWFEAERPPAPLRPGAPVRENDSALTGRRWCDGRIECEAAFARRVRDALTRARHDLAGILGRAPEIMAFPFDRSCPASIAAARSAGFRAVTGGLGENRPGEDPAILSRVHVQDRAFGGGPLWLEALALRARVNAASGRLAWHLVTALAARLRRRRFGRPGYGALS